jgi:hypothetical protein
MRARRPTALGRLVLALLAAAVVAPAARAGDPCLATLGAVFGSEEGGVGGTGLTDPGGIGGTGHSAPAGGIGGTGHEEREGGIGGTGLDPQEGGIGGTGVVGTVTGFGSVCVNGLHVDYDANTPVEIDGQLVSAERLAVGQVVEVDAMAGTERLQARRIRVRHAVVGPVTGLDTASGRLQVAGQSVAVPRGVGISGRRSQGAAPVEGLPRGGFVAVSGLRRSDGVIVATRVVPTEAREEVSVEGPATRVAPGTFYVSGLRVEARDPGAEEVLRAGGMAKVTGRWKADRGVLEDARVEAIRRMAGDIRRLSVEGYVQERGEGARFRLPGIDVDASEIARQLGDTGRDARVRVGGRLLEDGTLRAERIEVDDSGLGFRGDPRDGDDLRAARSEREDRDDREDREDRSGRGERAERPDRGGRTERPERVERPDRVDRSGRR